MQLRKENLKKYRLTRFSTLTNCALEEKINNVILVQLVEYTTQTMQLKTPDVNSHMSQEPHVGITQHQQSINSMLQIESRSDSIKE